MLDIELKDIISVLGQPTRHSGHQYYFRCPACRSRGGDNSGDNLLFHDNKKILKCFACDEGSKEVLRLINQNKTCSATSNYSKIEPVKDKPKWYEINKDNLIQYLFESMDEVGLDAQRYLFNRQIRHRTAGLCGIGYDDKPSMVSIGPSVTFPMFSINHNEQLVGFELREIGDRKIIKHTLDSPSCICGVYGRVYANRLIITEGFIDAYSLVELMEKRIEIDNYRIATGSHGCKSILPSLSSIDLSIYSDCYLILDNDEAGEKATQDILREYPFFKDKRDLLRGCKDINEYLCRKRAGYYQ